MLAYLTSFNFCKCSLEKIIYIAFFSCLHDCYHDLFYVSHFSKCQGSIKGSWRWMLYLLCLCREFQDTSYLLRYFLMFHFRSKNITGKKMNCPGTFFNPCCLYVDYWWCFSRKISHKSNIETALIMSWVGIGFKLVLWCCNVKLEGYLIFCHLPSGHGHREGLD